MGSFQQTPAAYFSPVALTRRSGCRQNDFFTPNRALVTPFRMMLGANPRDNALASMSHSGYTIAGLAIAARKGSFSTDFSRKFAFHPAMSAWLKTVLRCPENGGWPDT
jgi:hypothetical protein